MASGNEHHFPYPAASRTAPLNKNKTPLGTFRILMLHNIAKLVFKIFCFYFACNLWAFGHR